MPKSYLSDKACARFIVDIYDGEMEKLLADLKKARFISIMIDGATDEGNLENENIYIKFFDKEKGVVQSFFGIEDVKHANADGIIAAVDSVFQQAGLENWRDCVVFLCADGAAVNMGRKNGVAAKLKENIEHLLAIHCVAHRLELGMVDSIKDDAQLKKLQEVLQFLYQQYHYSPKALRELRMLAQALEEKVLKPTNLRGARWLPYIHKATKILCTSYAVFVAHFEDQISPERTPQPSAAVLGRAKNILKYLKCHKNVQFMHFMCDTLDLLKTMSLQFQQNDTRYQTLITHIESRLGDLSTQSLVAKFHALDHHNWPSGEDFILHGQQDVEALCRHYQAILQREGTSSSEVMAEYRLYKVWAKNRKGPLRETLQEILQRDDLMKKYKGLSILAQINLTMAISTAACERGFSCMKRVKNDWRSSLATSQLNRLMFLSIEGPSLETFDAKRAVLRWWGSGPRSRKPGFTSRVNQPTEDEMEEELIELE
ncbi:hypothetical protein SKAU_G00412310 [Synaphobranchus kaupii]|nr:hypothetical protein SKAU_G00412310 [Synaphobranchus kaupii]